MKLVMTCLACLPLAGCYSPATCGWSFQVGTPSTVSSPALLSPGQTQYTSAALAAGPLAGAMGPVVTPRRALLEATMPEVEIAPTPMAVQPKRVAAPSACTLDDMCKMLERIDANLQRAGQPPAKPLPRLSNTGFAEP